MIASLSLIHTKKGVNIYIVPCVICALVLVQSRMVFVLGGTIGVHFVLA